MPSKKRKADSDEEEVVEETSSSSSPLNQVKWDEVDPLFLAELPKDIQDELQRALKPQRPAKKNKTTRSIQSFFGSK